MKLRFFGGLFLLLCLFVVGLPSPVSAETEYSFSDMWHIEEVVLSDNDTEICTFTDSSQTYWFEGDLTIRNITVQMLIGGNPPSNGNGLNVSITSPLGVVFYFPEQQNYWGVNRDIANCSVSVAGHVSGSTQDVYRCVWFVNLTEAYVITDFYTSILTVKNLNQVPSSPQVFDTWTDGLYYSYDFSAEREDTYTTGTYLVDLIWVLIVFLPSMVLCMIIPKVGFIAGILFMSMALYFGNVMPLWLFGTTLIGVILVAIRGGD